MKRKPLAVGFTTESTRLFGCQVVHEALAARHVWPDEIEHGMLRSDERNLIGRLFQLLCRSGVLKRSDDSRPSRAAGARGRTIFRYDLVDGEKAKLFLEQNTEVLGVAKTRTKTREQAVNQDPAQSTKDYIVALEMRIAALEMRLARWGRPPKNRKREESDPTPELIS